MSANARAFVIPIAQAIIIGMIFVAVLLIGYRNPSPHDVRVEIVADASVARSLQHTVDQSAPGGFVVQATSKRGGLARLRAGTAFGVIEPGSAPRLLYAGANGPTVTASVVGTFGAAFGRSGQTLTSVDDLPASSNDSAGLPLFYMVFGVVLASYLYVIAAFSMAREASAAYHFLAALIVATVLGTGGALIARFVTHSISTDVAHVAVLLGLASLAVNSTTYLCLRVAGIAGNLLSTIIIIVLGSASGGILAGQYSPGWLEALRPVLPMGVALDGIRRVVYFDNAEPFVAIAVLATWAVIPQLIAAGVAARGRRKSITTQQPDGNPA